MRNRYTQKVPILQGLVITLSSSTNSKGQFKWVPVQLPMWRLMLSKQELTMPSWLQLSAVSSMQFHNRKKTYFNCTRTGSKTMKTLLWGKPGIFWETLFLSSTRCKSFTRDLVLKRLCESIWPREWQTSLTFKLSVSSFLTSLYLASSKLPSPARRS